MGAYEVKFGNRQAFAKPLHACDQAEGLERVRFTSPHPRDLTDNVIIAMAKTPNVMPQFHMPLQSGSDAVLKVVRRPYRRKRFLGILERVRETMPHTAITTDIIVDFPGETDGNFEAVMDVVCKARLSAACTFQYSKHLGTPTAEMQDQVTHETVQERYEQLVELAGKIAQEENHRFEGQEIEAIFALGEGWKDSEANRTSGRARDNRLVHIAVGEEPSDRPRPGDITYATIIHTAPHHLNSDTPFRGLRRIRGDDVREAVSMNVPKLKGIPLGMPNLRRP